MITGRFPSPEKKGNKIEKGNKIMENPFLSIEYRLFNIKQLNDAEIILLSFILSHQKQNKDFYYTDEQISSHFNGRYTVKYIGKMLKHLTSLNLIKRISSKEYYSQNKKWGNRRIIKINIDNLELLINNPVCLSNNADIMQNNLKEIDIDTHFSFETDDDMYKKTRRLAAEIELENYK